MLEIIYEFVVKEDTRGQFELAYGPGGSWSKLFSKCPGFRGTTVLRDTQNPRRYMTVDIWETKVQREQAFAEHKADYDELMIVFDKWTDSMTELGSFRVLSEATVRSHSKKMRGTTSVTRRRS